MIGTELKNILTFIIPVRHPANAKNWDKVKSNLTDTVKSIAAQKTDSWKAIIIANTGSDLPALPAGFDVKWVDFAPNELFRQGNADQEVFREAVRLDKGRRILAGMLYAGEMSYVMVVDDDDYISRNLTSFVAERPNANGWFIKSGYVWSDGGRWLYRTDGFSQFCGSSHIIRADLFNLPESLETADDTYIRRMLGSHVMIEGILSGSRTPLEPLPFLGAVYRIGHPESHSRSNTIFRQYIFRRYLLKRPWQIFSRISKLRLRDGKINEEYFGG
jgi:glycosyltransferase involved in cell wall biosynthesis